MKMIGYASPRVMWMLAFAGTLTLILAGVGIVRAQEGKRGLPLDRGAKAPTPEKRRQLWLFFSPTGKNLSEDVRAIGELLKRHEDVELRPCLLVDDWEAFEHPTEDFTRTLKELRSLEALEGASPFSIRVWDEEGLVLARQLGIERLPAYALLVVDGMSGAKAACRRAHLAYGCGARLEDLLRCK